MLAATARSSKATMLAGWMGSGASLSRRRIRRKQTTPGTSIIATNATPRTCTAQSRRLKPITLKAVFVKLAIVEDRHAERWRETVAESGRPLPRIRDRAADTAARVGREAFRHVGHPALDAGGRRTRGPGVPRHGASHEHRQTHKAAVDIASDSAVHARELAEMMGREGEPWHVGGAGGYLRSVVYGFNDGLTANFGLVAGVLGAGVAPHIVIISGVAGAIADALSMGSSGYLAAKSEAEVQAHQIELERHEMRLMPDLEEEELALIYQAKGLPPDRARETARAMMQDPSQALDAMVRES